MPTTSSQPFIFSQSSLFLPPLRTVLAAVPSSILRSLKKLIPSFKTLTLARLAWRTSAMQPNRGEMRAKGTPMNGLSGSSKPPTSSISTQIALHEFNNRNGHPLIQNRNLQRPSSHFDPSPAATDDYFDQMLSTIPSWPGLTKSYWDLTGCGGNNQVAGDDGLHLAAPSIQRWRHQVPYIQPTMEEQRSLLFDSASLFPLPHGVTFSYGTSGFRTDGSKLSSTVFRIGVVAALRSLKTGYTVGLMITASHNTITDNGVKIADPDGGMMTQDWEPFAEALANAPDPQSFVELVINFVKEENISFGGERSAEILLGRDTRPTGESLLQAAKQGIESIIGSVALDMGVVTTPQLHWMVRSKNMGAKASESDYFMQLSESFRCLMDMVPKEITMKGTVNSQLVVDGANGVGGDKLQKLKELLPGLEIEVRNTSNHEDGILNDRVGADYVQKEKVAPSCFGPNDFGLRCASFDGDADRLVYFRISKINSSSIDLIDGDKILSLFALFIKAQLHFLNKSESEGINNVLPAKVGIVQTAYANGASTDYLKQLGLEVALTPTGVKHLHKKAAEYDIGIYFEANGHGTILFSEDFLSELQNKSDDLASSSAGSETHKAALRLLALSKLINQSAGDALSGLLLVEVVLQYMGWSMQNWIELYDDLPSRQLKVKVADRTAVFTTNVETQVVQPFGLQEAIDTETAKYHQGRCFVRPSGTEDIIRVYAEASSQEAADSLARSVSELVDRFLGFRSPQHLD